MIKILVFFVIRTLQSIEVKNLCSDSNKLIDINDEQKLKLNTNDISISENTNSDLAFKNHIQFKLKNKEKIFKIEKTKIKRKKYQQLVNHAKIKSSNIYKLKIQDNDKLYLKKNKDL